MGKCPCPRCLIPKDRADKLGTKRDRAQRVNLARVDNLQYRAKMESAHNIIYQQNRPIDSVFVQRLLKPESLVPNTVGSLIIGALMINSLLIQNAFSARLSRFGFNLFSIFLVDFMHEFELGVWKKVFIHLLRILACIHRATNKLDER